MKSPCVNLKHDIPALALYYSFNAPYQVGISNTEMSKILSVTLSHCTIQLRQCAVPVYEYCFSLCNILSSPIKHCLYFCNPLSRSSKRSLFLFKEYTVLLFGIRTLSPFAIHKISSSMNHSFHFFSTYCNSLQESVFIFQYDVQLDETLFSFI